MKADFKSYNGERGLDKTLELCERLTQRTFIGTDTGVPYRSLNHWGKLGLFEDSREDTKNWRRFSFVEFIWIRVIDELRKVGLEMDAIKAMKEAVLKPAPLYEFSPQFISIYGVESLGNLDKGAETKKKEEEFWATVFAINGDEMSCNLLQVMIVIAIAKRCPVILIAFPDGEYLFVEEQPRFALPAEQLDRLSFETHVRIPITGIVREFLASDLAIERLGVLQILEPKEQDVLAIINSGKYKSVKIRLKGAKITDFEMEESHSTRKKVVDVLAAAKYQTITIERNDGHITKIENTIRHKY